MFSRISSKHLSSSFLFTFPVCNIAYYNHGYIHCTTSEDKKVITHKQFVDLISEVYTRSMHA
uniref:Uncharacterized protein n=1 Tax=Arundo donax TaxID=35708 RepID=A0A0A9GJI3_ARUDO